MLIRMTLKRIFLVALFICAIQQTAAPQNWSQWRGPNRNGIVSDFITPTTWPAKLKLQWKTPVGSGISSPIVSQGKAWVHTRKEEQETVSCIDLKTGKILWSTSYAAPFSPNPGAAKMGKGPFATPLLSGNRLYTLGITAILSCFDAQTGKLQWRKEFGQISTSNLFCGTTASPLMDKGNLIVLVGDDRSGSLIAFDPATGQERWKWSSDSVSYASPVAFEFEGIRQIIAHTNNAIVGLAAETGKLLWKMPFIDPPYGENIVTPLLYRNMLLISNGTEGVTAIRVTKEGGEWNAKPVWKNLEVTMYMSSPVLDGDYLYGMSSKNKGHFFCLNVADFKVSWTTERREGDNASLLHSKDVLFILTDDANLTVAKKSVKGFEPVAKYSVANSPTWAQPTMWGKYVLIKDDSTIALWSLE